MTHDEIFDEGNCKLSWTKPVRCYDLDNIKFLGGFNSKKIKIEYDPENPNAFLAEEKITFLKTLTVDLGPIAQSSGMLQALKYYSGNPDQGNIYSSMRENLKKYKIDYEFSERDRELFNKKQKGELFVVYENGQVVLRVFRVEKDYSQDLWLHLEYRDVDNGAEFFEKNKPKKASASDF